MLANEGLLEEDENAQLFTEQQIGRLIHLGNLAEVQRAIFASFAAVRLFSFPFYSVFMPLVLLPLALALP